MLKLSLLISLLSIQLLDAQIIKSPFSDLQGAKKIPVNTTLSFADSPVGYGSIKEFSVYQKRGPIIFKEERNSIWLEIDVPFEGELTYTINPHSLNDDYDWMLFNYDAGLKEDLQNGSAKPVRSNNARNEKNVNSQTGLKDGSSNLFMIPGPGDSFCKPLTVSKGDKLALIIDNIYDGGSGFDFNISLKPALSARIEGVVTAKKSGSSLRADIVLEDDSTGVVISKTNSDPLTGKYSLPAPKNRPVNITASNPSYLFSTADLVLDTLATRQVDFQLDTIKAGNKLILFNIHFLANKDEILPSSQPDIDRLTKFLTDNPMWTVRIVGHTNNNVFAEARYLQRLSFERAVAVKNYLLKNAIPEKKISCVGLGGKSPLVTTNDQAEGMKNLRVEVLLTGK